jgi:hypothetical protein
MMNVRTFSLQGQHLDSGRSTHLSLHDKSSLLGSVQASFKKEDRPLEKYLSLLSPSLSVGSITRT